MTILTKSTNTIKKPDLTKSPLVDGNICDEEKVDVVPDDQEWLPGRRASGVAAFLCLSLAAMLVAMTGITCGLMLYRQYLKTNTIHRYQGFCSIPLDSKQLMAAEIANLRQKFIPKPLFWSGTLGREPEFPVPITSAPQEDDTPLTLDEEVDIDDDSETISVFTSGGQISFIHDFHNNYTGIIDEDRCFVMDLDRSTVLKPDIFVVNIEEGGAFDTSRVQVSLRALFPAVSDLVDTFRDMADRCRDKPTYRLQPDDAPIRKRSAEKKNPDYIQFAGKHIQEIEINNLGELLQHEKVLPKD